MEAYLGLGTNLGDKRQNMLAAISEIDKWIGHIVRQSAFLETEPWGFDSSNTFLNAVVVVDTDLPPHDLLRLTQSIERNLGRTHKTVGGEYHDRIIDIDILIYGDLKINTPDLIIPHPLISQRQFVLQPLSEVMATYPLTTNLDS